jgi:hypothetical protein
MLTRHCAALWWPVARQYTTAVAGALAASLSVRIDPDQCVFSAALLGRHSAADHFNKNNFSSFDSNNWSLWIGFACWGRNNPE